MASLWVGNGHTISVGGKSFGPGDRIPAETVREISQAAVKKGKPCPIAGFVADGRLFEGQHEPLPEPPPIAQNLGGPKRVDNVAEAEKKLRTSARGGPHKWDFNPDEIGSMSLEDLQRIAIERDPQAPQFAKFEDAFAHMTRDFKKV